MGAFVPFPIERAHRERDEAVAIANAALAAGLAECERLRSELAAYRWTVDAAVESMRVFASESAAELEAEAARRAPAGEEILFSRSPITEEDDEPSEEPPSLSQLCRDRAVSYTRVRRLVSRKGLSYDEALAFVQATPSRINAPGRGLQAICEREGVPYHRVYRLVRDHGHSWAEAIEKIKADPLPDGPDRPKLAPLCPPAVSAPVERVAVASPPPAPKTKRTAPSRSAPPRPIRVDPPKIVASGHAVDPGAAFLGGEHVLRLGVAVHEDAEPPASAPPSSVKGAKPAGPAVPRRCPMESFSGHVAFACKLCLRAKGDAAR